MTTAVVQKEREESILQSTRPGASECVVVSNLVDQLGECGLQRGRAVVLCGSSSDTNARDVETICFSAKPCYFHE